MAPSGARRRARARAGGDADAPPAEEADSAVAVAAGEPPQKKLRRRKKKAEVAVEAVAEDPETVESEAEKENESDIAMREALGQAEAHGGAGWDDESEDEEADEEEPDGSDVDSPPVNPGELLKTPATVGKGAFCQGFAKKCTCCNESSSKVAWYDSEPGVAEDNSIITMPKGEVCFLCGKACLAFPKMPTEALYKKVKREPDFREAFNAARARAAEVDEEPRFTVATVFGQSQRGLRVENRCALVDTDDWTTYYQYPPDSVEGITVATMTTDQGEEPHKLALGVLMSFHDIPEDLPYRECTLYTDYSNILTETVLGHASILREGQAKETWHVLNDAARSGRPQPLRTGGALAKLLTHSQVQGLVAKHKVELKRQEELLKHGAAAEKTSSSDKTTNKKGLQLPSFAAPVPKKTAAPKATGRGGGGGLRRRASAAAASAGGGGGSAASVSAASVSASAAASTASGPEAVGIRMPGGSSTRGSRKSERSSAPDDGEELSVHNVLWGTQKVRMKCQAATTAGETVLAESLTKLIVAVGAAESLQPPRLQKMSWSDMQKCVEILEQYGETMPPTIARAVTKRHCENLLLGEKFQEWVQCACPWRQTENMSDEIPAWSLMHPTLVSLVGEGDNDEKDTAFNFLGAFFNDIGFKMLQNVANAAPGATEVLKLFVQTACSAYDDYRDLTDDSASEDSEAVTNFIKFCRGMSALVDPTPCAFQASAADVDFLKPAGKKDIEGSSMTHLHPPASAVMSSHLRESAAWQALMRDFATHAAADWMSAPTLLAFEDTLSSLGPGGGDKAWYDRLHEYDKIAKELPDIRGRLRRGATDRVEGRLLKTLTDRDEVHNVMGGEGTWKCASLNDRISAAKEVSKILKQLDKGARRDEVMQMISEKLTTWREEDSKASLVEALGAGIVTSADAGNFLRVLQSSKGVEFTPAIIQGLVDMRSSLHSSMANIVNTTDPKDCRDEIMSNHWGALDAIHAIKEVGDHLGVKDRPRQTAFRDTSSKVISLKAALGKVSELGPKASLKNQSIPALDEAVKSYCAFQACKKYMETPEKMDSLGSDGRFVQSMLDAAAEHVKLLAQNLGEYSSYPLSVSAQDLTKHLTAAQEVAGGLTDGKKWADDLAGCSFDKVFKVGCDTVLKANGPLIDSCRKRLAQAIESHTAVVDKYKPFCAQAPCMNAVVAAKAVRDRCEITRFEALVIKSWKATVGKDEDKRRSMIDKHLAKFNSLGIDPGLVQPALWQAVRKVAGPQATSTAGAAAAIKDGDPAGSKGAK